MTVRDCTSAKDFLQFKKEIRGSRTHLIGKRQTNPSGKGFRDGL